MPKPLKILLKILGFLLLSVITGAIIVYFFIESQGFRFVSEKAGAPFPITEEVGQTPSPYPVVEDTTIQNVIILIGDGMGINQVELTRYRYKGINGRLEMERLPFFGLVETKPADDELITDSAAGATALATGKKTRNGMVGMTPDSVVAPTILEALQKRGWSTGLITTSAITDATPASFATHVPDRGMQHEIAMQMAAKKINFLAGGRAGFEGIYPTQKMAIDKYAQKNLGYTVIKDRRDFAELNDSLNMVLFDNVPDDVTSKRSEAMADLSVLTQLAIDKLSQKGPFFLMVEQEGTDTGGHVNDADYLTESLKELDDAVAVALKFAEQNQQTIVLVTADHETGGLTFNEGARGKAVQLNWATTRHTGQPVPLYAYGPYAHYFSGKMDNTDVPKRLGRALGLIEFR